MQKDLIIFDGSNFYHGAKRLDKIIHLTSYGYRKLAQKISGSKNCNIEYCVGEVRQEKDNPKSKRMYSAQQSLFYSLGKQGITVKKGYMLKSDGKYHEKGVDVRIAVDILRGALKNEYRRCFVISSDTDLIPAILDARTEKKEIIYVGFENFLSKALQVNCTRTIILDKKIINSCK